MLLQSDIDEPTTRQLWSEAWFNFVESEQPIELTAKPEAGQTFKNNTELRYGRTNRNETRSSTGPGGNGK